MQKKHFRRDSIQRLKSLAKTNTYFMDKKIVHRLYAIICEKNAKSIMLYLPLKTEVNLYPLILRLRKEKKMLYVPFMEGKSFRLVKYRLPLRQKQFGIKEPLNSRQHIKKIDVALIPIVGIDKSQRRIGFGKGMYDRFFEKHQDTIKENIFVARVLCYSKNIITNDHDIHAHRIITATR